MKLINNLLIISIIFSVKGGELPKEIQKCSSTNNDKCVATAVEEILKLYPTGNPDFKMPNASALELENLKVSQSNSDAPMQIHFEFLKCTMYGLEKLKVVKASGFDKKMEKTSLEIIVPNLLLKGDYQIKGQLLLLSLNGKGKGEVLLKDAKIKAIAKFEVENRNGKHYAKLKKFLIQIQPNRMVAKLENAFNGNPEVSQTINDVINENWKDVWSELQTGVNQAMENIISKMLDGIFNELPLDDIYLD